MNVRSLRRESQLTLFLTGRLDATTSPNLDAAVDLGGITVLVFDLDACTYVSSAGLRVFLRAHRDLHAKGGRAEIVNVSRELREVFDVTGLSKLVTTRPKVREISVHGLELLSAGFCGECYRLDQDSVVKLYNDGIGADLAEQEKEFSKAAFVAGIPTAISYDVVRCGTRTGVIYEMLEAETLSKIIRNNLNDMDRHAKLLADVAHSIHSVEGDPTVFPDLKTKLFKYLDGAAEFMPAKDIELLRRTLTEMPDATSCVHFDIHTNNIMIRNGEPLIIDMGDLSRGSYLFDVGLLHGIYAFPELGTCEVVTKIPNDKGRELWDGFVKHYFATRPSEDLNFFLRHRYFFSSLRLIVSVSFLPNLREYASHLLQTVMLPGMRRSRSPE
jgi:uncharacterized protein (TIGR02172 family)